jgi:hypothetical protein
MHGWHGRLSREELVSQNSRETEADTLGTTGATLSFFLPPPTTQLFLALAARICRLHGDIGTESASHAMT